MNARIGTSLLAGYFEATGLGNVRVYSTTNSVSDSKIGDANSILSGGDSIRLPCAKLVGANTIIAKMSATALCMAMLSMVQTVSILEQDLETALGTVGLSTKTARFDSNLMRFFGGGEFRTPFFDACFENPWRIPFFAETLRRDFGTMAGRASESMSLGARLCGYGTRRTLLGDSVKALVDATQQPGSLKRKVEDLKAKGIVKGAVPDFSSVPSEVQQATTMVLTAAEQAATFRQLAFSGVSDMTGAFTLLSSPESAEAQAFARNHRLMKAVDMSYLAAGGHDFIAASQGAFTQMLSGGTTKAFDVEFETTWGWVRLCGGKSETHPDRPTLLIIDTSGNDTYLGVPTTSTVSNFASVILDVSGNDSYLADPSQANSSMANWTKRKEATRKPGTAGALMGFSVLIDGEGDDLYRTHRPGLGSGRFGIAALVDRSGNDTYDGYADSLGFGHFGIGILDDLKGDDRYFSFTQSQGCGLTMGFGYLADRDGGDVYASNDGQIDFASPQSAEHNVSMSQGAGNGRRADYLDGHSLAGGVGILYDPAGIDRYSCGVFGQGVGYWMGVGMLWDSQGIDTYTGQWYVHGAAAHFAIGFLEDETGNDNYNAPMNMAQGAGDDQFRAPNLSLGAGNANGIGIFVDLFGNDTYESSGITLGKSAEATKQSLRSKALSLGVFFDGNGSDKYPAAATWATNGVRVPNWMDKGSSPSEGQMGVFWDR